MTDFVRAATLTHFPEVARAAGLDPLRLLAAAGLDAACLREPELRVPAAAVQRLLETAAAQAGQENFSLRMAESRRLSNLGVIGLLVREQATLRQALATLTRYSRLHNQSLFLQCEEADGVAVIREETLLQGAAAPATGLRQATELTVGALYRFLSLLLGPDWRPRRVCFTHAAPRDTSVHQRLFGPVVRFDQDFNGLVLASRDLDTPLPSSDPVMARYARQVLQAAEDAADRSLAAEVRQLILVLLPAGRCTVEQVARQLGVDRRTVHRQLAREGTAFTTLLDATRTELARRHLAQPQRPLSEVAQLLGFSGLSAFSRWHRSRFGDTASARRGRGEEAGGDAGLPPGGGLGAEE